MPASPTDISSIDFAKMIGGPLSAVVEAQAQSALTTVNFIKEVGFQTAPPNQDPDSTYTLNPVYVTFRYPKEVAPYQPAVPANPDTGTPYRPPVPAMWQNMELQVPLLTMVPIPSLRIQKFVLNFNAKINSVTETQTDEKIDVQAELEAKAKIGFFSVSLKVNAAYQKNTMTGDKVDKTYSMNIDVEAVQDEIPEGLDRILGILENAIASQPVAAALDDNVPLPPYVPPHNISLVGGDKQKGPVSPGTGAKALPQKLVVQVHDNWGAGIADKKVTWTVLGPDNTEGGAKSVITPIPDPSVTDASGRAEAELTLGTTLGTYQVQATTTDGAVPEHDVTVYFTAQAYPVLEEEEERGEEPEDT